MRGSLLLKEPLTDETGIIPAHAGLTATRLPSRHSVRDHPRACGAHRQFQPRGASFPGSSPRMRGSRAGRKEMKFEDGIIPAHAGLTSTRCLHAVQRRDHPRACGAHMIPKFSAIFLSGSSPRMRGSHTYRLKLVAEDGIIPAHAGLTCSRRRSARTSGDHPRACGAHLHQGPRAAREAGSSPRMRGSRSCSPPPEIHPGIIPAHAGLTLKNPNNDAILSVSNPIFYSVLRVIL